MTWNTEYTCPEGYFLVAFRTTENPKLLTDILELHCNRPTNLFTSYSSTVKVTANPWTQGAKMEFSCPSLSYMIGFAVRSADLGGTTQDVSDLTLICAYPLNSECSTNSLLSTNTTVSAPCNYQSCVANVSWSHLSFIQMFIHSLVCLDFSQSLEHNLFNARPTVGTQRPCSAWPRMPA